MEYKGRYLWLMLVWGDAIRSDYKDEWNCVMSAITGYKHALINNKVKKLDKQLVELNFLYNLALRRWIMARD